MRPHGPGDFAECAALWADPEVVRFTIGRPASEEEAWTRYLRYIGHWTLLGFGYWTVREKTGLRYVGEVGFADFRRAIEPPLGAVPEIGWVLAPWAQGQGFAGEAVAAATRWGDGRPGFEETVCIIVPEHLRSIQVARRAGYRERHRALYKEQTMIVLARPQQG